ncbi:MAG TPA: hypothetical protein VMI92_06490 [Steroidobacteraceae bacterium]|nr:hypothetical protein [Steroidobacteraceae bacterium]
MTEPEILKVERLAGEVRIWLRIQPELAWFKGHFPGTPLLPAVVQTSWAVAFARQYFPLPAEFRSLNNMKFMRFIMPGSEAQLRLRYHPAKQELEFAYRDGEAVSASGRMGFGA